MIYTIRSDIRRAVLSKGFLAGVLGMVVVIAFSAAQDILTTFANSPHLPNGYHAQIVLDALLSDSVALAVPILCAFPFTPAFVDDMQSGFIKQFLPRSGINAYIWGKLVACAISGGLVLSLGILLAYFLSTLVFTPMETPLNAGTIVGASFILLVEKAAVFFFSGVLWSLLGFTFASVTNNRYIAYASPFIFYYILIILYERYFHTLYYFYPKEWLNPSHPWILDTWGLLLFLSLGATIIGVIFTIFAGRKFHHG